MSSRTRSSASRRRTRTRTDPDKCLEAPNLILPATNELIWGGLAFLILLVVLWKFAYPPIKKGMDGRTERIRNEIQTAEATRAEAEEVLATYQAGLAERRRPRRRASSKTPAALPMRMRADRHREPKPRSPRCGSGPQPTIEASKAQAIADLTDEVAALAIGAAEVVVQTEPRPRHAGAADRGLHQPGRSTDSARSEPCRGDPTTEIGS